MTIQRRAFLAAGAAFAASGASRARAQTMLPLDPAALTLSLVTARNAEFKGRRALLVALSDERQRAIIAGGLGNGPTMAMFPGVHGDFVLETDIAASLNGKGPPDVRGFPGIAFRARDDATAFDCVYLRMTNGTRAVPPPPSPRDVRAVQYIAHPDFHFDVSRQSAPGVYEKAAPVALDTWHRFRLEVVGARARVWVDGTEVLTVADLRSGAGGRGRIGLFVDDGTDAYFADTTLRT